MQTMAVPQRARFLLSRLGSALLDVLAPRHCELCGTYTGTTARRFEFVCNACADSLPPAPYPDEIFNGLVARFSGDALAISRAVGLYALADNSPLHNLLYALKYKGRARIGNEFGRELGALLSVLKFGGYDALVPVPIHPAKLRERGYNQAEQLANGMSVEMGTPLQTQWLHRARYTQSQTTMNAITRMENVRGVFSGGRCAADIRMASILLVDDVLTTGSTLNACANALLELGAKRVDVAALAVA